jgi:SAM-dependent methyltransferase
MTLRTKLKQNPLFKWPVIFFRELKRKRSLFRTVGEFISFSKDWHSYQKLPKNPTFTLKTGDIYPRLFDKTTTTGVDPVYFYQNCWCAKKIFENKPEKHVDIGSDAKFIGIISQYVPTVMVDIRPLTVHLPGLSFAKGSILELPFKTEEISSLSSICVIEHIGLGRYGDPIDSFGSEKAVKELIRVLAIGGNLYISVPIDNDNKVYFNAHRAFTRDYVLKLFEELTLIEEKYIYGDKMCDFYDKIKGFGTGLYCFIKPINR